MFRSTIISLVFILALTFMVSCSGEGGNVIAPDKGERDVVAAEEPGNTVCLGLWQFVADKATGEADLVQLRSADKIINVLGFMEPPPLTAMDLDWPNLNIDFPNGTVDVGVIFTHPINDAVFTGFDVRGVVFGPDVTNADGLTIIPSPEFFKGVPFGYQDGLLGAPDNYVNYEGLAGYKYYCDSIGADEDLAEFFSDTDNLANRGCFSAGMQLMRNYHLDWNDVSHNFLIFNYAIYANYNWPVGAMPWDVDDWDISTANSAEAFCCSVTELANYLYFGGGSGGGDISLQVEAWDWQGDISDVTVESCDGIIIPQTSYDVGSLPGCTSKSNIYEFYAVPGIPTQTGDLDILITVTDNKTFGECWFLDLLPTSHSKYGKKVYNCFIYTTTVIECPEPIITSIDPDNGWVDATLDDIIINGKDFVAGPSWDARLKKAGETDIVGTDVHFINLTTITVDFYLGGVATGQWDVVVTNGCGVEGTSAGLFEVVCQTPTVTGINPPNHYPDNYQFPATITGNNFLNGSSLAVKLKKTGQADIFSLNVAYISTTQINCNLTIPSSTAVGLWDVQVTNGCGTPGTGVYLFDVCTAPVWNPGVTLSGSITKARATNSGAILEYASTYRRQLTFNVSGSNATAGNGGPYTYQYYVSTSNSSPTGSPVGWVSFSFNNSGSFTVPWYIYSSIAPDRLYLFVHAGDGVMLSGPVMCTTQIQLSRVCYQPSSTTYQWGGWSNPGIMEWHDLLNFSVFYGANGKTGYCWLYRGSVNFGSTGDNQFEFFIPFQWWNESLTTSNYLLMQHGTSSSLGTTVGTLYGNINHNGQKSYNYTGYTGMRYIGFYAYKGYSPDNFAWYMTNPAFYEDPS